MSVTGENPFNREKRGSRIIVSAKEDRTVNGVVCASKWEARCYRELLEVFVHDSFTIQPRFELQPKFKDSEGNNIRAIEYRGDFLFGPARIKPSDTITNNHILIDSKGMEDAVYKMKKKMLLYKFGQPLYTPKRVKDLKSLIELLKTKYPEAVRVI